MREEFPYPCCAHCECPDFDRTGHDDSCRLGCNDTTAEAADRDRFQRTLTDRIETFDEAELLRALRHLAHDPAAMDAVNDALDAIERGDA